MVVVSMCEASGEVPVFWRDEEDEQLHQSGLVCNFVYLQSPGCKIWMYCAVFSLLIYVASLSRKKEKNTRPHFFFRQFVALIGRLA